MKQRVKIFCNHWSDVDSDINKWAEESAQRYVFKILQVSSVPFQVVAAEGAGFGWVVVTVLYEVL